MPFAVAFAAFREEVRKIGIKNKGFQIIILKFSFINYFEIFTCWAYKAVLIHSRGLSDKEILAVTRKNL